MWSMQFVSDKIFEGQSKQQIGFIQVVICMRHPVVREVIPHEER